MSPDSMPAASQVMDTGRWTASQVGPLDERIRIAGRIESRWSVARLAMFLLAALGWVPLRSSPPAALLLAAVGIALFLVSIRLHRRAAGRHAFLERRKLVLDESRSRIGGAVATVRAAARPQDAAIARGLLGQLLPAGPAWPLTDQERDDLDLYAEPTGLFGLLNRTSTAVGAARLRDLLENPLLEPRRILQRQEAVRWLAGHHEERTRLMGALAGLRRLDPQMLTFEGAVQAARTVLPPGVRWVLRAWSVFMLALSLWAAWLVLEGRYGPVALLGLLSCVNVLGWLPLWPRVRKPLLQYQRSFDFARGYLEAARQAGDSLPADTQLDPLRRIFDRIRGPGALPGALPWIAWSTEGGPLQALLDLLVFYDAHIVEGIQRHIVPHREPLLTGLAALAELEALLGLACFAAEQPRVCWPEPVDGTCLSIRGGLHPLIEPSVAVPNDIALARRPNLWIITGSNMSGKSTFLRMTGVNVLLAQIGSAAAADQLHWSPLRLISDLRIRDSLGKGESYFLAEVRHLRRMIVPPPGDAPVLGLVDEPFRGTNHREQRAATLAIIEHLVRSPGLFLVATHDSTVTRLADGAAAQNLHFQEQLSGRELTFDYQLRPGPARTRNAIRVLEREQYPADLVSRALAHADAQQEP